MTIELTALNDLDVDLVQQELAKSSSLVQERWPSLDLRRGVLHDVLLYLHAVLAAAERTNLNRYLSARSLQQIQADPSLADVEIVNHVLSNWRLTRKAGTLARGEVVIVLSAAYPLTLTQGTAFLANGLTYRTTQLFSAVPDATMVRDDTDRLLTSLSDGTYAFTVEVEATEIGAQYALAKDASILPSSQPANFVTSYAASNFTGGTDTETNDEMLRRLLQGIACKGGANRVNMQALLRALDDFDGIPATSILGYGDAEMLRDKHTIFPIGFGGRVDWYIRGQPRLLRQQITKSCTLVSKEDDDTGIWQFAVTAADLAGFYEVRNIRLPTSANVVGGYEILSDTRALDLTGTDFVPDIDTLIEGVYSSYQTAIIRFHNTDTDVSTQSLGVTVDHDIEIVGTPHVGTLQAYMTGHAVRHLGADLLVKAAVPCFLQLSFTIYKRADEATPDLTAIRQALVDLVNQVGFIGRLYASRLTDVIHTYLSNDTSIGAIDMLGRILRPDGTTYWLRDDTVLAVEDDPARMVTANTVQFFLEPEDIGITVETGVPMPV